MILIKNALLANNSHQDILIDNGKFIEIGKSFSVNASKVIDCQGRLLLSGMIDPHVHFRDPGFPHKETAMTGSMAALRGGVTSIIDMPNTKPLCVTQEALEEKRAIYTKHSYTNFGFHFGGDARDNSDIIPHVQNFGALKIFLNESTGHMLVEDDKILDKLFQSSKYIAVHAEGEAVDKAIFLAKKHQNILYLCHISQEGELSSIRKAKKEGLPIYAEVCPHHILFNASEETELLIMKPRLRTKKDQEALLTALDEGLIDTWGTDHAPHLVEEKKSQLTYGITGIEFALEILLRMGKELSWDYQKIQNLYSSHAQKIFGITGKGMIAPNYDADFVIIDHQSSYTISEKDIVSKCGWSPYVGQKMESEIKETYIGGELVYHKENNLFSKSSYIKELKYDR